MTAPEIKHQSGEVLLQIVYADPGRNGFYYREKKPDSVAKFYRSDALMHSPDVLALVTAAREMCENIPPWVAKDVSAALAAFEGVK